MRRAFAVAVAFALVAACSSFTSDDTAAVGGDGGIDGASPPITNGEGGGVGDGSTVVPPDASTPLTLLTAAGPPSHLATDGAFIYWVEAGVRVMRAPIQAGAKATQIGATEPLSIDALVVDKDYIAWGAPSIRSLAKANLGAAPIVNVNAEPGPSLVMHGEVYWLDPSYSRLIFCPMPCTSSDIETSATAPLLLATGAAHLFYFATVDGGSRGLQALPHLAGTPAVTLAAVASPLFLAASGNRAFWIDGTDAQLRTVVVTPVPNVVTLGPVPASASSIGAGADGLTAYVTTLEDVIAFSAASPGATTSIAHGEKQPSYVVATTDHVLWANLDDNTIRYVTLR
jgi:hypothetical protein